jgi:hypothetical protein
MHGTSVIGRSPEARSGRRREGPVWLRLWPGIGVMAALAREITALYVVACGRVNMPTTQAV